MPHLGARRTERRRYPRARFAWRAAYGFKDTSELVTARTVDVSVGGVSLVGPLAAAPGDEMVVVLSLKERVLSAYATVIRSELMRHNDARLQLEFNWFSDAARDRLRHLTRADP